MNVVIAGGSGFLGSVLAARLRARGDEVHVLTRQPSREGDVPWTSDDRNAAWVDAVETASAVINLAGAPVDERRWTAARKTQLLESRRAATSRLVDVLSRTGGTKVLLNASAVGIYGDRGDEILDEGSSVGNDFLAQLCRAWEAEASRASSSTRVVLLRTGLVLDGRRGALRPLLTPFRLGLGGPLGTGRQYWSWIHQTDWANLAIAALDDDRVRGPVNLTAPNPVTNREFARTLGRVLHRPAVLPAPAFALRLLLGEMADAMVLGGQRVMPAQASSVGFRFAFPTLEPALEDLLW